MCGLRKLFLIVMSILGVFRIHLNRILMKDPKVEGASGELPSSFMYKVTSLKQQVLRSLFHWV